MVFTPQMVRGTCRLKLLLTVFNDPTSLIVEMFNYSIDDSVNITQN